MRKKELISCALMLSALVLPMSVEAKVAADSFYANQSNAQRADITNWVASTPSQISHNMSSQSINVDHLDGERYVIQWGDTLWGISQATGISVQKLAYDNHITNVDLIYAGDVLILKRDGDVPSDYHYTGTGHYCAYSSVTINNYYEDNSTSVIVNNTSFYEDNHIEHNYPSPDSKSDSNPVTQTPSSSSTEESSVEDSSSSSTTAKSSSSTSSDKDKKDSSSTSSDKDKKDSSSTSSSSTTKSDYESDEDFQDDVQDELNNLISEKDPTSEEISFLSHKDEAEEENGRLTNELDSNDLYDQPEDPTVKLDSKVNPDALTKKDAKAIAKAIYDQLEQDGKLEDLKDAKEVQLEVTFKSDTEISFNADVYTEPETSDSSSSSSDVDESSSSSSSDSYSSSKSSTESDYADSSDSATESSDDY